MTNFKYFEIIKNKFPDKKPQRFIDDTYEGIVWNALDTTPNPTKAELDSFGSELELDEAKTNINRIIACIQTPVMSGTSTIPFDNTSPLITEGTEILSVSCKPSDALSKLVITGDLAIDCGTSSKDIIISFFKETECIGVVSENSSTPGKLQVTSFTISDLLFGSSINLQPINYSIRIGVGSSATWYLNRTSNNLFNGLLKANSIIFSEYA